MDPKHMLNEMPTVGRIVWYWPTVDDHGAKAEGKYHAAVVTDVLPEGRVNLGIWDLNGSPYPKKDVPFVTVQDADRVVGGYAEWPVVETVAPEVKPYVDPVSKAAKTKAAG